MDRLWAPWRMKYIQEGGRTPGCIFCVLPAQGKDEENLILYRAEHCFIMLNTFPYNSGHLMVAPFKHTANMYELEDCEILEINHMVRYSMRLLSEVMGPEGFNIGINLGQTAGAGVKDHIHWHIVPRWNGDMNFMPVIGEVKVLPESLEDTYARLRRKIDEIGVD